MSTIINATTTNGVVIQPDNSGSLVLQTDNGTTALTIDTSQNATFAGTLTATGKLASASMPTGSVIQVVNATYATQFAQSGSSYADTGITASITPSSTSNKILILARIPVRHGVGYNYGSQRWVRNSAVVIYEPAQAYETGLSLTSTDLRLVNSYMILDSPASTSSVTYKTQSVCHAATNTYYTCPDSMTASIILMEIKA
jgi:hypothetical protein